MRRPRHHPRAASPSTPASSTSADMSVSDDDLRSATSITIAACGTSWHAGLAGKFMIERLARLPVDVDYASEYRGLPRPHPQPPSPSACSSGPVRRNRRHHRCPAGTHRQGLEDPRHLQRRRLRRHAPRRWHHHHQRRPRDRRRVNESLHRRSSQRLFTLALHLAQVRGTITDAQSLHLRHRAIKDPRQARRRPPLHRRPHCHSLQGVL